MPQFPIPIWLCGLSLPAPPPVSPPSPTHPGGARWCRPQCSSSSRRVSPSLTRSQPDALSSAVSFQHFGTFSRVSGKEKYKRKTILPLRGSPNPFPILSPSPSNFCPISPTALPALSLGSGPALPLLPHSVPSPFVPSRPALSARGGWPHSFHGDGGGGCRKSTKTRGGWGEGEGAAGTWHKEPCGLGGHRHPSSATPLLALIRASGLVLLSFWSNSNGPYWKRKEKVVKSNQKYVAVPALLLHTYTRGWGG